MELLLLPDDIIMIMIEMTKNIFHVSIVNKEINKLCQIRLYKEKEKYNRKIIFYDMCSTYGTKNFFWNAFTYVKSTEECNLVYKKYIEKYEKESFLSRVNYVILESNQITSETWTMWIQNEYKIYHNMDYVDA
jgi:hypothetical protein